MSELDDMNRLFVRAARERDDALIVLKAVLKRFNIPTNHHHRYSLMFDAIDEMIADKAALSCVGVVSGEDARRLEEAMDRNSRPPRRNDDG